MAAETNTTPPVRGEKIGKLLVAFLLLLALLVSLLLLARTFASPKPMPSFTRLGGKSRVETAIEASRLWHKPQAIVLAPWTGSGSQMIDAGVYAAKLNAPLLYLSAPGNLSKAAQQVLKRMPNACIHLYGAAELSPPKLPEGAKRCTEEQTAPAGRPSSVSVVSLGPPAPIDRPEVQSLQRAELKVIEDPPEDWQLSRRVVFATAQNEPDLPDMAVAITLAAHLNDLFRLQEAPEDQRVSVVVLPRYLQFSPNLQSALRKQSTEVEDTFLIGEKAAISNDLRDLLKTTMLPLDAQKRFEALQKTLETASGAIAAIVAVLLLFFAARKGQDVLERQGYRGWSHAWRLPALAISRGVEKMSPDRPRRREPGPRGPLGSLFERIVGETRAGYVRLKLKSSPRWIAGAWARLDDGRKSSVSSSLDAGALYLTRIVECEPETGEIRRDEHGNAIFHPESLLVRWEEVEQVQFLDAAERDELLILLSSRKDSAGIKLGGKDLHGLFLEGRTLRAAHLEGCNLSQATLAQADLREANLDGALLRNADLEGANLEGANLRGADLHGALLDRANLKQARLDLARLNGARADAETVWPAGFDPHRAGVVLTDRRPETANELES